MILKIYRKECTNTVNLIISSWQTLLKPVLQAVAADKEMDLLGGKSTARERIWVCCILSFRTTQVLLWNALSLAASSTELVCRSCSMSVHHIGLHKAGHAAGFSSLICPGSPSAENCSWQGKCQCSLRWSHQHELTIGFVGIPCCLFARGEAVLCFHLLIFNHRAFP